MTFEWLKRWMPRGLYGRAALILLVPIVTLQLVVSAAILQRYFEGVARQMTEALSLDLAHVIAEYDRDPDRAAVVAEALEIALDPDPPARETGRLAYDLTGIEVIRVLTTRFPEITAVDLRSDWRRAQLVVDTGRGPLGLSASRLRASASNPHQLLVLMLSTGILMTWVAYLFLRNQLRPIRRLAEASDAFGKGRVVEYSPSGATEVRSAGRAFLDMRARIESMIEQRTLMLSGVSHDLRTPLTRMKLGLSMQEDTPEIRALQRDVEDMEQLLSIFLDFARGAALDDPVEADPVALARRVVADFERGGGTVSLVAPEGGTDVPLREQALRRALDNLVSNALRYGGAARITVALPDRAVRFTVEDDGPGIPAELRDEALRPFQRLDPARNQDKGSGVGLGLAIARDIARRHGGTLNLGDSADMGGLRVDLVLPR
jgi:two-component system osmolarity sensor histidine kinase EnvZ